ncbi:hypothetical protein KSP40_PGU000895 [Platanthera guangdongensis]|uniref:RNA polymerase II-associated protein 3 n=1 Tax=Platanthera guangdongensis TaxID=2320717 RepID=A0ABR2M9R2_9ASPA
MPRGILPWLFEPIQKPAREDDYPGEDDEEFRGFLKDQHDHDSLNKDGSAKLKDRAKKTAESVRFRDSDPASLPSPVAAIPIPLPVPAPDPVASTASAPDPAAAPAPVAVPAPARLLPLVWKRIFTGKSGLASPARQKGDEPSLAPDKEGGLRQGTSPPSSFTVNFLAIFGSTLEVDDSLNIPKKVILTEEEHRKRVEELAKAKGKINEDREPSSKFTTDNIRKNNAKVFSSIENSELSGSYLRNLDAFDTVSSRFLNEEKLPDANSEKELGNDYFKHKKYLEAIECYSRSIAFAPTSVAFANRAMAYLKLKKFEEAENDCTYALNLDDRYVKAYSRRATSRKELMKFDGAMEDADFALRLETNSPEIRKQYSEIKEILERLGSSSNCSVEAPVPSVSQPQPPPSKPPLEPPSATFCNPKTSPKLLPVCGPATLRPSKTPPKPPHLSYSHPNFPIAINTIQNSKFHLFTSKRLPPSTSLFAVPIPGQPGVVPDC